MSPSLPTSRTSFGLLAALAVAAAVVDRTLVSVLPFAVLAFSAISVPAGKITVYRPQESALAGRLFGASVPETEEHAIDAEVGVNAGAVLALVAGLYLGADLAPEAVTVFVATLPVAYLASTAVPGAGVHQAPAVAGLPLLVALILGAPVAALTGGVPALMIATAAYLSSSDVRNNSSPSYSIGGDAGFEALFLAVVLPLAVAAI